MPKEIDLPATRHSVTHKFAVGSHEAYLTIGITEDGRPAELFIRMAKTGSTLRGLMDAYCRAMSLALQYGLPLDKAIRKFEGMTFEPLGDTDNPDIPECQSIIDYIARYLKHHYA